MPALQFHRTARSPSTLAWIQCMASSTTIPGRAGTVKSFISPPLASPRKTLKRVGRVGVGPSASRALAAASVRIESWAPADLVASVSVMQARRRQTGQCHQAHQGVPATLNFEH